MKQLGRIKPFIPTDLTIHPYCSLILPHLDYGDTVYEAMSDTLANQLQVIQNNCLRICLVRNKRSPTDELHETACLMRLDVRRKQHVTQQVYKGISDQSTPLINNMFTKVLDTHTVHTRSSVNSTSCTGSPDGDQ